MIWLEKNSIPPGNWPFLQAVHNGLLELKSSLEVKIDLTESSGQLLITGCMRAYRQAIMRRSLDLAQATIASWNIGAPLGSIVCSRALLETIATHHSFIKSAERYASEKEWEKIGRLVDAYAFSSSSIKRSGAKSEYEPPRIGKVVTNFIEETQPGCTDFWHQICDTAHPNGQRMMEYAGKLESYYFVAHENSANKTLLFTAVYNSLYSCCWLTSSDLDFDILLEVIRNGEELPSTHPLIAERKQIDSIVEELIKK